MTSNINDLIDAVVATCEEDHLQLEQLIKSVRPFSDEHGTKPMVLLLLRLMLDSELIKVGSHATNGRDFVEWQDSPRRIIERIDREWERLKQDLDGDETVWFTVR